MFCFTSFYKFSFCLLWAFSNPFLDVSCCFLSLSLLFFFFFFSSFPCLLFPCLGSPLSRSCSRLTPPRLLVSPCLAKTLHPHHFHHRSVLLGKHMHNFYRLSLQSCYTQQLKAGHSQRTAVQVRNTASRSRGTLIIYILVFSSSSSSSLYFFFFFLYLLFHFQQHLCSSHPVP